jgi:hypothetical protein
VGNEKPNSANRIIEFFGKRETLGDKTRETLSTAMIEAFNRVSQTRIFVNTTMTFRGNNLPIRLPKIGISNSTLPINRQTISYFSGDVKYCEILWCLAISVENQKSI